MTTSLKSTGISLENAQKVVAAAQKKASALNCLMNIAVVDAGANLVAFGKMDGAWLGSTDISIRKAKTARYFNMTTGDIGKLSQPGGSLFGIEHSNGGLITFPGGVLLKEKDGTIVGAIGVSGSTVENDHLVAVAGAAMADTTGRDLSASCAIYCCLEAEIPSRAFFISELSSGSGGLPIQKLGKNLENSSPTMPSFGVSALNPPSPVCA